MWANTPAFCPYWYNKVCYNNIRLRIVKLSFIGNLKVTFEKFVHDFILTINFFLKTANTQQTDNLSRKSMPPSKSY
jgi:hypothetical protein